MEQGDYASARTLHEESLAIRWELGHRAGIVESLESLAYVLSAIARSGNAARILGAADRLREEIGFTVTPSERASHDRQVAAIRAAIHDDSAFDSAWRED